MISAVFFLLLMVGAHSFLPPKIMGGFFKKFGQRGGGHEKIAQK